MWATTDYILMHGRDKTWAHYTSRTIGFAADFNGLQWLTTHRDATRSSHTDLRRHSDTRLRVQLVHTVGRPSLLSWLTPYNGLISTYPLTWGWEGHVIEGIDLGCFRVDSPAVSVLIRHWNEELIVWSRFWTGPCCAGEIKTHAERERVERMLWADYILWAFLGVEIRLVSSY